MRMHGLPIRYFKTFKMATVEQTGARSWDHAQAGCGSHLRAGRSCCWVSDISLCTQGAWPRVSHGSLGSQDGGQQGCAQPSCWKKRRTGGLVYTNRSRCGRLQAEPVSRPSSTNRSKAWSPWRRQRLGRWDQRLEVRSALLIALRILERG